MKRRRLSTRELRTSAVSALAGKPVVVELYIPVIFRIHAAVRAESGGIRLAADVSLSVPPPEPTRGRAVTMTGLVGGPAWASWSP
jgi:hypothetical protein